MKLQNVEFTVWDGQGQFILSKDTAVKLGVLRVGSQVCSLSTGIEHGYPHLFTGIGKLKGFQIKTPIDKTVNPVIRYIRLKVLYFKRVKCIKTYCIRYFRGAKMPKSNTDMRCDTGVTRLVS